MTDKQIIIDGVDVSGCLFHSLTTMGYAGYNYCKCFQCVCECHRDCYYKQFKRSEAQCEGMFVTHTDLEKKYKAKEQECEKLEKQNDILLGQLVINDSEDVTVQISQSQFEEYNQLKAENEELYKWLPIVTRLEEQFKSHEKAKGIDYQTYTEQVFTELDQLKEELQEIREEFRIETLYWKDPNERPHRTHRSLKFLKLKQALTEIKEIAEKDFHHTCWKIYSKQLKQILQKISEVLDETK